MVNAKSEKVRSQGRPLKPGGLAGTRKIIFADNLMEMLVEKHYSLLSRLCRNSIRDTAEGFSSGFA
jgi:hypothetical protein